MVPATVVTVAGANTADLRPAKEVTKLWVSLRHLLALLSTQNRKFNKVHDLFMDTNRGLVFLVIHIVRISFVCIHLCATSVGLKSVLPLEWESMEPIIYLFIYFLFFY